MRLVQLERVAGVKWNGCLTCLRYLQHSNAPRGCGIATRLDPGFSALIFRSPGSALKGRIVTQMSDGEMIDLFRQQLRMLTEWRLTLSTQIAASQETIEQSRALIVQIDEQVRRMKGELGRFGAD